MKEAALHNLKLVGTTATVGGQFRQVRITGETAVTGDIACKQMTCVGTMEMKGNMRADMLKLTGECKVEGSMEAVRLNAVGQIDVAGDMCGDIIKLTGEINVAGNCEVETLNISGALNVAGLVNADRFNIRLHGPCHTREIGGGSITIKRSKTEFFKKMFLSGSFAELSADLIEGDTLHLEYTRAKVVRGNRITLGPGCEIGRVEYRSGLNVGKDAIVQEKQKI